MGTTCSLLSSMNIIIKGIIFFNIYITFYVCSTTSSTSGSATVVLLKQNSWGILEKDRSFISGMTAGLCPCKKWKSLKRNFAKLQEWEPWDLNPASNVGWAKGFCFCLFSCRLWIFHLSLHSCPASVGAMKKRGWELEPKQDEECSSSVHAITLLHVSVQNQSHFFF